MELELMQELAPENKDRAYQAFIKNNQGHGPFPQGASNRSVVQEVQDEEAVGMTGVHGSTEVVSPHGTEQVHVGRQTGGEPITYTAAPYPMETPEDRYDRRRDNRSRKLASLRDSNPNHPAVIAQDKLNSELSAVDLQPRP